MNGRQQLCILDTAHVSLNVELDGHITSEVPVSAPPGPTRHMHAHQLHVSYYKCQVVTCMHMMPTQVWVSPSQTLWRPCSCRYMPPEFKEGTHMIQHGCSEHGRLIRTHMGHASHKAQNAFPSD